MDESDIEINLYEFIERTSLITGISLPINDIYLKLFINEFIILLRLPKFRNLCIEELLLAVRMSIEGSVRDVHGEVLQRVELFGASISIDYVSQILNQYISLRNGLDSFIKTIIDEQ